MYLQIDEGFVSHPKTIAFMGRMQDPNALAYLIKLWTWAVRSAPTGDLSDMNPWGLENIVGYRLADGKCYAAMVACGFIEEHEDGAPAAIHNWSKRTGGDIAKMEKEAARKRNYRAAKPWEVLRLEVLNRDGFTCCDCNWKPDDTSALDVHHVVPLRKFEDKIAGNHPSNLKTLCTPCHVKAETAYRKNEARATAPGRRQDGAEPVESTAPWTANTDQTRPVQTRSESESAAPSSPMRSDPDQAPAGARSNGGAKIWSVHEWRDRFGRAWVEKYQRAAYGDAGDTKACLSLGDVLAALPDAERLSAQAKAPEMFAEFLASAEPRVVSRRHPFVFFAQEWGGLRVPKQAPSLVAAPVARGLDPRCLHHAKGWTSRPKPLQPGCPRCDEIATAERQARAEALARAPDISPPPLDPKKLPTREQLQELRRNAT